MNEPRSMDDVARTMRENLPAGMTPREFGQTMDWGRGSEEARSRIATLTLEQLQAISLTAEQALVWALAYDAVRTLMPTNPSAAGRADLMRRAAELLGGVQ
jgi:hypothetical protein